MKPSYHNMKLPMIKGAITFPCRAKVELRIQVYGRVVVSEVNFNNEVHVMNYTKLMYRKMMDVLTIKKRPMQEHIGGSQDIVFFTRNKALSRFFEMSEELGYDVEVTYKNNLVTYESGGRGHDHRIELELTNVLV